MKDYKIEAYEAAQESVLEHINEIQTHLFDRGYMFYEEFEITNYTARYIPEVIDMKYNDSERCRIFAHEEMIKGEGACGIIYNAAIISLPLVQEALRKHYANEE